MKDMTVAGRMRWVAGGLYALLFCYQCFIIQYHLQGMVPAQAYLPWLYAVAVIPAAGAMAVWMFSGKKLLPAGVRRAVVMATILFVVFELFTYSVQAEVIRTTLYYNLPSLYGNDIWVYFFIVFRFLLMILAAFFVTQSSENYDYLPGQRPKESEVVVVDVELDELAVAAEEPAADEDSENEKPAGAKAAEKPAKPAPKKPTAKKAAKKEDDDAADEDKA